MTANPLEGLSEDEQQALAELAQARVESSITTRDFLKAAGVIGTGAVLGGGAIELATQDAAADASTTDDDGDVGQPGDRVDVYADGVDANSVDTDDASIAPDFDETIPFTAGQTRDRVIDPASTSDLVLAGAVPATTPGTAHGYNITSIWVDGSGNIVARVTETEGNAGDARVFAWIL